VIGKTSRRDLRKLKHYIARSCAEGVVWKTRANTKAGRKFDSLEKERDQETERFIPRI